jgi:hypothetical protein
MSDYKKKWICISPKAAPIVAAAITGTANCLRPKWYKKPFLRGEALRQRAYKAHELLNIARSFADSVGRGTGFAVVGADAYAAARITARILDDMCVKENHRRDYADKE